MARTAAQEWAQQRNWLKARVTAARVYPYTETFTREEMILMSKADNYLRLLLQGWNARNAESKQAFLKKKGGAA